MSGPDVVNDFEAWATISARLYGKSEGERRQLLAELQLTEVWDNANLAWARALADDIVDMRLHRPQRYAEICARVLDMEASLSLEASLSDDLSRQSTHRIRLPPALEPAAESPSFVATMSGAQAVETPRRNQARTQLVDRAIALSVLGDLPPPAASETGVTRAAPTPDAASVAAAPAAVAPATAAALDALDGVAGTSVADATDVAPTRRRSPFEDSAETSVVVRPDAAPHDALPWPLEHYARYVAEREAGHESVEAIDARWGLSGAAAAALRERFGRHLAGQTDLRARFERLVAELADALHTMPR